MESCPAFHRANLVFGDALCSFNPIYGQGMTVAGLDALALRECFAAGSQNLARRFFQSAARLIEIPWQIAVGSDLQQPSSRQAPQSG